MLPLLIAAGTQAATAMQINVATHQEQLVDTYVQDVVLASEGFTADPSPARDEMLEWSSRAAAHGAALQWNIQA